MKTSIKKLQRFAAIKHDRRSERQHQCLAQDELALATQDMNDMRDCYDRLLSAAAAMANSVYEFTESLGELGDCLLEKTALNDDEECGKVLLMLGKVQFQLKRLFDGYRSHITQTITVPSVSLLNELQIVEEMKRQCDEKRDVYEDLLRKQTEKGSLINSEGKCFLSPQLLQEAHEEYDEEANVFVLRMKSLKQGQSRSFLTQASRHHAAQLYFFKKALNSLEIIEPHVRLLAEQLHIDYHFSGLEHGGQDICNDDDESEVDADTEDGSETHDSDVSFDNGQTGHMKEESTLNQIGGISLCRNSISFQRGVRRMSKSAPLFPEKKLDSAERMMQMGSSGSHKFTSYVLPTPDEMKSPCTRKLQTVPNLWNSSPFDQNKSEILQENEELSGIILETESVLKESNCTRKASHLRSQPTKGLSYKQKDSNIASYAKKAKWQAFSGPLTGRPWPNNQTFMLSSQILSPAFRLPYSGSLLRTHQSGVLSRVGELHELPLPPGHSGPLIYKRHELSTVYAPTISTGASTPPIPPERLTWSYSIPAAGGSTDVALHVPLEGSESSKDD